jgi:hypothetical protein
MEILEFIVVYKFWILLAFAALEKYVKKSKSDNDDILFDMFLDPIIKSIKKITNDKIKDSNK